MNIKPILSEEDLSAALARVEQLWGAEIGTPESNELDVLALLMDFTAVRATRASSGAGKKGGGPEEPVDHALGDSRDGLTTKIHMVCDANGVPLRFLLSPGL